MENAFYLGLGALILIGACVLVFVLLFKTGDSNYPLVGRGVGLALLAGLLKVVFLLLSEKVSPAFDSSWANRGLIVLLVIGLVMMMAGYAKGSS